MRMTGSSLEITILLDHVPTYAEDKNISIIYVRSFQIRARYERCRFSKKLVQKLKILELKRRILLYRFR